jgi:hypothetical protein
VGDAWRGYACCYGPPESPLWYFPAGSVTPEMICCPAAGLDGLPMVRLPAMVTRKSLPRARVIGKYLARRMNLLTRLDVLACTPRSWSAPCVVLKAADAVTGAALGGAYGKGAVA